MQDSGNRDAKLLFSVFSVSDETQNAIRKSLQEILDSKGYGKLLMPVFSCINELLVNAVKANFKNLYFENYMPKNKNKWALPYCQALELFRNEITNNGAEHLEKLSREMNICAELQIFIDERNILNATITNPHPMTEVEEHNVIKRMEVIETTDNLADYISVNKNDTLYEGAGLGLIYTGMILKALSLSASQLNIHSDRIMTTANLMIPLNQKVLESYLNITDITSIEESRLHTL
jgi:hypothetical protein